MMNLTVAVKALLRAQPLDTFGQLDVTKPGVILDPT